MREFKIALTWPGKHVVCSADCLEIYNFSFSTEADQSYAYSFGAEVKNAVAELLEGKYFEGTEVQFQIDSDSAGSSVSGCAKIASLVSLLNDDGQGSAMVEIELLTVGPVRTLLQEK